MLFHLLDWSVWPDGHSRVYLQRQETSSLEPLITNCSCRGGVGGILMSFLRFKNIIENVYHYQVCKNGNVINFTLSFSWHSLQLFCNFKAHFFIGPCCYHLLIYDLKLKIMGSPHTLSCKTEMITISKFASNFFLVSINSPVIYMCSILKGMFQEAYMPFSD